MHKNAIHTAFHAAVTEELRKADAQHSEAADLYEMLAVLGEEFGELQQAALQFDYEGGRRSHLLEECIQVGAMALKTFRFITNNVTAPRVDRQPTVSNLWAQQSGDLQCPTCGRSKAERGRHEPLAGTGEVPWCPDAFHA